MTDTAAMKEDGSGVLILTRRSDAYARVLRDTAQELREREPDISRRLDNLASRIESGGIR
jgi:hypothetical protein